MITSSHISNVLVVDDAHQGLSGSLADIKDAASQLPGAHVTHYSPLISGYARQDFNWKDFDILLLDGDLDRARDFRCLREFGKNKDFPYAIVFTDSLDESEYELIKQLGV